MPTPIPLTPEEVRRLFPQLADVTIEQPTPKPEVRRDGKDAIRVAWEIVTFSAEWPFEPEQRFHPIRKWRFDWSNESIKLAIEVDGVTHYGKAIGRHQGADGIEGDFEKGNAAILLGWRVLHFTQRQIAADPFSVVETILEAIRKSRDPTSAASVQ